jgi:hypothetical protein
MISQANLTHKHQINDFNIRQIAGNVILNIYNNYDDIPDNYKFLYIDYKPLSTGNKRRLDDMLYK